MQTLLILKGRSNLDVAASPQATRDPLSDLDQELTGPFQTDTRA
jgi:hypothetical protein